MNAKMRTTIHFWNALDVMDIKREWCTMCAKNRMHEYYQGWGICFICGNETAQTMLPMPDKQEKEVDTIDNMKFNVF